jgi:hypothetical protein
MTAPAPADRLRAAAGVLTAVDQYRSGERAQLPLSMTDAQWDATAEIPSDIRTGLAAVFEEWAWAAERDPDLIHRVGGPETLALADAILAGVTP